MTNQPDPQTFEAFKKSFSYGSRTDLSFKFLKSLSNEDAANFIQQLFWKLGQAYDSGQFEPVIQHICQGQQKAYAGASQWQYDTGPFMPLPKPVAGSRLALLTSSGHFVAGHDPQPFGLKNMTQAEATARIDDFLKSEPQLSKIPADTPNQQLRVRHGGYDIRGAQADPNVAFPLQRLREMVQAGQIGALATDAYSFVGACSQLRLTKRTGPQWVELLQQQNLDAVLLVPV